MILVTEFFGVDGSIQLVPLTKLVRKSERRFNAAEIKFALLAGVSMTTLTACGGGGGECGDECGDALAVGTAALAGGSSRHPLVQG